MCHFVVNKTSQFLVSLLIIFSPIFYYRLVHQDQGHIQLTSHFLILAAFVYYLELEPDNHKWIFLVPASFLIQTYIALMILVIFLASYANVYWKNWKQVDLSVAMRFLRVPIVTLIVLYTVGFFATSQNAMAAGGYGGAYAAYGGGFAAYGAAAGGYGGYAAYGATAGGYAAGDGGYGGYGGDQQ